MSTGKAAAIASSVVVVLAIVAGLTISGSPFEQRLKRLDDSRVQDLRKLSRSLVEHWNNKGILPTELAPLLDGRILSRIPVDPETTSQYEYFIDAPNEYRLCARFDRPSRPKEKNSFWEHEEGRKCYSFEVNEHENGKR